MIIIQSALLRTMIEWVDKKVLLDLNGRSALIDKARLKVMHREGEQ